MLHSASEVVLCDEAEVLWQRLDAAEVEVRRERDEPLGAEQQLADDARRLSVRRHAQEEPRAGVLHQQDAVPLSAAERGAQVGGGECDEAAPHPVAQLRLQHPVYELEEEVLARRAIREQQQPITQLRTQHHLHLDGEAAQQLARRDLQVACKARWAVRLAQAAVTQSK